MQDVVLWTVTRATDNIWIEQFWRTIKRGYVYLNPANDGLELYRGIKKYITYYNRRHSSLKKKLHRLYIQTKTGGCSECNTSE